MVDYLKARSICRDCALSNGAYADDGMVCTVWPGICDVCRKEKHLCSVSDWNWPKGKEPRGWSLLGRD